MGGNKSERFLGLAIGLLLLLLGGVIADSFREKVIGAGDKAPDFSIATDNGRTISRSNFGGRLLVLNFWATWCPPCKAEMPVIQSAYQAYRGQGLVVLAIDSTTDQDEANTARDFASTHGLGFPVLADVRGEASQLYQVQALPTSFFVDRQGKIAWVVVGGPMAEALIRSHLETLLKAAP